MSVPERLVLDGDDDPRSPPCGIRMIGGGATCALMSFSFTSTESVSATIGSGGEPAAGVIFGIAVPAIGVTLEVWPGGEPGSFEDSTGAAGMPFDGVLRRGTIGDGPPRKAGGAVAPMSVAPPTRPLNAGAGTKDALFVVAASG